ncbi:MAG: hypothetical protein V9F01_17380 [Chitinophagaceae bacterium]
MAGIMFQWRFQTSINVWWMILAVAFLSLLGFFFVPFFNRYKFAFINGIITGILFFSVGAILAWQKDIRNDKQWLGNFYQEKNVLIVTLDEPPVEKTKSIKANATVSYLLQNDQNDSCKRQDHSLF